MTNVELYGGLAKVSKRLLDRKLRFVGHCQRARGADQPIKHLYGIILISLGVLAAKELAQDLNMQKDYLMNALVWSEMMMSCAS